MLICICTFRRAHLKECFDVLKREVPSLEDKKTSNLNILRSALKHIQVSIICFYRPSFDSESTGLFEGVGKCEANLNLNSYCTECEQV